MKIITLFLMFVSSLAFARPEKMTVEEMKIEIDSTFNISSNYPEGECGKTLSKMNNNSTCEQVTNTLDLCHLVPTTVYDGTAPDVSYTVDCK
jgi:hypothetical protein